MKISDSLEIYRNLLPGAHSWDTINTFLLSGEASQMNHGEKHELNHGITVVCLDIEAATDNLNVLEAHRRYYDLHHTISGSDNVAFEPVTNCTLIKTAYQEEGDYILFEQEPANRVAVDAGYFCMIGPETAHMALYPPTGLVRKLVFKIPCQAS